MAERLDASKFFAYARERERIRRAKESGAPPPWTEDWILQKYRFCNIHRENDKTTIWIRENVRKPLYADPRVFSAMVFCRLVNRIESLAMVVPLLLAQEEGYLNTIAKKLKGVEPIVTAAYMIHTPTGEKKLDGVVTIVKQFLGREDEFLRHKYLKTMHAKLCEFPFIGGFLAYEIVTDLRHTIFLDTAPDINTWSTMGPGAARGLDRLMGYPVGTFRRNAQEDQDTMLWLAIDLLRQSRDPENWPAEWEPWELREVEHTLCEFDKYERARTGEGSPKQLYRNGG